MNRLTLVQSLVLLALVSAPVAAQLQTGQRIRIHSRDFEAPVVGTLVTLAAESLLVETTAGVRHVASRRIQRLEVSRGIGHAGKGGAAIGAAIGSAGGAIWGAASHAQCSRSRLCFFRGPFLELAIGTFLGSAAGAGVGYLVGTTRRGEQWQQAALDVAIAPGRVQLSVRF